MNGRASYYYCSFSHLKNSSSIFFLNDLYSFRNLVISEIIDHYLNLSTQKWGTSETKVSNK